MISIKEILEKENLKDRLAALSLMKHELAMEDLKLKDKFKKYKNIILSQSESISCIRSLINKKHGLAYDNCPATHARERLLVDFSKENSEKLIWVEGGAVLSDGVMKYWDINKYDTYTCIRCLNYSLLQGVRILAALNKSGFNENEWDISFHSAENHARYLLARNTIDQME